MISKSKKKRIAKILAQAGIISAMFLGTLVMFRVLALHSIYNHNHELKEQYSTFIEYALDDNW